MFDEEGNFKILQVADMHFKNGDGTSECADILESQAKYPCSDLNTTEFYSQILDIEKPDLVVFTGDQIDGGAADAEKSLLLVLDPVIKRGLPFAAVLGNHDEESSLTRKNVMETLNKIPGSLTATGPESIHGFGNYVLTIQREDNNNTRSIIDTSRKDITKQQKFFPLYFLDSGDYANIKDISHYDWIYPNQISWYLDQSQKIREESGGANISSLMFFHIPILEYERALLDPNIKKVGKAFEPPCTPHINSGLFTALIEENSVRATFVGHDHKNDYCANLAGINLCYGGGVGYTSYGMKGFARRVRVIKIENYGNIISTYKRLDKREENFPVIDEQTLWEQK